MSNEPVDLEKKWEEYTKDIKSTDTISLLPIYAIESFYKFATGVDQKMMCFILRITYKDDSAKTVTLAPKNAARILGGISTPVAEPEDFHKIVSFKIAKMKQTKKYSWEEFKRQLLSKRRK